MSEQRRGMVAIGVLIVACLIAADSLAGEDASPPGPPVPHDGAVNVDPRDLVLSWTAVLGGRSYDVYLGTAPDELVLQKNVTQLQWKPTGVLARGECYYWQVGVRTGGPTSVLGPVWRFSVLPPTPEDAGLLAWYAFDEGFGNVSRDLSGNGSDAEVEQMTWGEAGTPAVDGTSVESEGSGWVHFPIPTSDQSTDCLTLAGWFCIRSQEEPAALWSLGSGQGSYVSFVVQPAGDGGPIMEILGADQSLPVRSHVKDPLPVDHWTHLAVLMDGPSQKITVYEDGAVVWTVNGLAGLTNILKQAREVFLGTSFVLDSCLSGGIDDVRLYARVLDAQEVARTMFGHSDGPYEPSPRHWAQVHISVPAVLQWQGDDSTAAYNLYTGTSPALVSLTASGLTNAQYTLTRPPADGQTLYWRVERIRDDGFVPGPLWQFSVTGLSLEDVIAGASPWWVDYAKYCNQIVPDVSLTDIDGRGHRFRDYRGRHLLVVLWASWCSVCRTEMTEMANLAKAVGEDQLAILAITDESDRDAVPGFLASHPEVAFPVCATKLSSLPAPFSLAYHFPSAFYIAPDGVIKLATVGAVPQAKMEAILAAAWPGQ